MRVRVPEFSAEGRLSQLDMGARSTAAGWLSWPDTVVVSALEIRLPMSGHPPSAKPAGSSPFTDPTATVVLLARAKDGDEAALNVLFERYMVPLKRWAHGRLPAWARDLRDTDDLVQESVMHTLRHVDTFEPRRDGAFLAYLRTALHNKLKDEIRRARRVIREPLGTDFADDAPSVIEEVIGRNTLNRYEKSLAQLSPEEREAVLARVELGKPYAEVAEILGKSSADAARMTVTRALLKLAKGMRDA
jgi:RNA polymerase sigma-70 factor, ECF subfamily